MRVICDLLSVSRATYYRFLRPKKVTSCEQRYFQKSSSVRRISDVERDEIMEVLHSQRFVDKAPAVIVATLLDEGQYLCSTRSMYRFLSSKNEIKERRAIARSRHHKKPELLATDRNQVWSWDITKLKGPGKWNYFYLYVIMDIFSRKVVGWGFTKGNLLC